MHSEALILAESPLRDEANAVFRNHNCVKLRRAKIHAHSVAFRSFRVNILIKFVESDGRMSYACCVPVFLSGDINTGCGKVAVGQEFNKAGDAVEFQSHV